MKTEDAAKSIIATEFKDSQGRPYVISPYHRELLSQIADHLQSQGGNSYDIAIGFMLYIANSLVDPDEAATIWSETTFEKCESLMHHGTLGKTLLADA